MAGHLFALIPGQRAAQWYRHGAEYADQRLAQCDGGAVVAEMDERAGECCARRACRSQTGSRCRRCSRPPNARPRHDRQPSLAVIDHRHLHQTTTAASIRAPTWSAAATTRAQRHAGAVADDAAARIVNGVIDRLGDQLPRWDIRVLEGQVTADLLRPPPHRQQLLHLRTEDVVSIDSTHAVTGTSLGGGPVRDRGCGGDRLGRR